MIIGNYMLLNLFLAILLKFISQNDEDTGSGAEDNTKIETPRSGAPAKVAGGPNDPKKNREDSAEKAPG